ncbi:MAG: hypothetical protein MEQ07_05115 [Aquimonas sp.]|nr:hypothetical protein [Aquimonas sp.]
MSLAEAAEQLAGLLGTSRPKLIERRDANQGFDFFYRLRGAGLNVELRSARWEFDVPQQDFRVLGLSVGSPAWRVLVEQGGWRPVAAAS